MANWSGISASLTAVFLKPSIVEPRLIVNSISCLDFHKFKQRGVTGVVIDKDNCITVPHQDQLAQGLQQSWQDMLDTFGQDNVLIVSNSVGTFSKDPALLGAESVSRNLRVPVLAHSQPKPGPKCVDQIARHFSNEPSSSSTSQIVYSRLAQAHQTRTRSNRSKAATTSGLQGWLRAGGGQDPRDGEHDLKLLVIGDRLATDMILSHRLSQLSLPLPNESNLSKSIISKLIPFRARKNRRTTSSGPEVEEQAMTGKKPRTRPKRIETVGILTTGLHEREGLGTTFLRAIEKLMLRRLQNKERNRTRSIPGNVSTPLEGERWEECLKSSRPIKLVPKGQEVRRIWELPDDTSSPMVASTPASSHQATTEVLASPSPRKTLVPRVLSSTSTLLSLPHTVPHFFRRFPKTFMTTLKSVPTTTLELLKRMTTRLGNGLLESLPRIAAISHQPLARFTEIYQKPRPESTRAIVEGFELGKDRKVTTTYSRTTPHSIRDQVERVIDKVEEDVRQARENVQSKAKAKSA